MSNANKVVTAIGSLAEMTSVFYDTSKKAGLPKGVCLELTKVFLSSMIAITPEMNKGEISNGD